MNKWLSNVTVEIRDLTERNYGVGNQNYDSSGCEVAFPGWIETDGEVWNREENEWENYVNGHIS